MGFHLTLSLFKTALYEYRQYTCVSSLTLDPRSPGRGLNGQPSVPMLCPRLPLVSVLWLFLLCPAESHPQRVPGQSRISKMQATNVFDEREAEHIYLRSSIHYCLTFVTTYSHWNFNRQWIVGLEVLNYYRIFSTFLECLVWRSGQSDFSVLQLTVQLKNVRNKYTLSARLGGRQRLQVPESRVHLALTVQPLSNPVESVNILVWWFQVSSTDNYAKFWLNFGNSQSKLNMSVCQNDSV